MGSDVDPEASDGLDCPDCGAEVAPTDVYCSRCGAQCRITGADGASATSSTATGEESRAAFRRRVHEQVAAGWEIEHDEGDSVVLVNRSLGSPAIHVLLFLLTAGLGNVVYAAYKYTSDADRTVLRRRRGDQAVDTPDSKPEKRSSFKHIAGGLALMLLGVIVIAGSGLEVASLLVGWYFLVIGAYLLPQVRERLASRHSLSTFGKTRSTEESVVRDTDTPCSVCMGAIDQGIERTYKKEQVFAGIPLYTVESGSNYYCRDCANAEIEDLETNATADTEAGSSRTGDVAWEREPE